MKNLLPILTSLLFAFALIAFSPLAQGAPCGVLFPCGGDDDDDDEPEEAEELDEVKVIIEINATDGDAGFHALFDGGGWLEMVMEDPDGEEIFFEEAAGALADQGLTENFFESAEPLCVFDADEPDEEVVPLADFLERFPAGEYLLTGETIEGDEVVGAAELTYNIPAAPDISAIDEMEFVFSASSPVVISWAGGTDLGEKCHDQDLVDEGVIADPADVEVVGWEVVIEPEDDEGIEPLRIVSAQLLPERTSFTIPAEFLRDYIEGNDISEFKFEVGAIEESGNQVFSEGTFEVDCTDC
jgi:hypothetical protein